MMKSENENINNTVETTVENKSNFTNKKFSNDRPRFSPRKPELDRGLSQILSMRAVSKTTTGGRVRSFSVLMLYGDGINSVGIGSGKSKDISEAMRKAEKRARLNAFQVPMKDKRTITHNISGYHCAVKVILKQAPGGTGLKAGGVARSIFKIAGIKDIVCKSIGNSMSEHNVAHAVIKSLKMLSSVSQIATRLNKDIKHILKRR